MHESLELGLHLRLLPHLLPQTQCTEQVVHRHIRHSLACFDGSTANMRQKGHFVSTVGAEDGMVRVDTWKEKNSPTAEMEKPEIKVQSEKCNKKNIVRWIQLKVSSSIEFLYLMSRSLAMQ